MAGLSTWAENAVIGWLPRGAMPAAPAATWLALWNGDPGDGGTGGAEVTITVRPAGRLQASFSAPAGGQIANAAPVDFGAAAGAASVSHFALFDAAGGGNMLLSGALAGGPRTIAAGAAVSVPAGALTVQLS